MQNKLLHTFFIGACILAATETCRANVVLGGARIKPLTEIEKMRNLESVLTQDDFLHSRTVDDASIQIR